MPVLSFLLDQGWNLRPSLLHDWVAIISFSNGLTKKILEHLCEIVYIDTCLYI